jgi:flagellar biosynthesis/type III secretory pathway chaperone
MDHDTYYQHLRLHHTHVANLRSFAITNVSNIKAEITIYDPDGTNPRVMSFEQALLSKSYGDTNKSLFYSIEPTQASTTEGHYLLVTNNNAIKEAETFIDMALASLTNNNSNNCAQVQLFKAPIARTNHINMSEIFQEYANKLKTMIPKMINLPKHPGHNTWKRRPPTKVNRTDDDFPPLTTPKKTKTLTSMEQDNTTVTGQTNLLTDVDVERIEQRQNELNATFTAKIEKLRQENETTQKTLQAQFESAMQALELRIKHQTQQIVSSVGLTINQAIEHMNAQNARSNECINAVLHQSLQNQADRFTAQMDRMISSPDDSQSNFLTHTPVRHTCA